MKPKIQSVHFDADRKLLQFAEEKVEKLSLFYDAIIGSEVILRLDKSSVKENKVAEIILEIKGENLFAKKQSISFEESIDDAVEALRKQVIKKKEKVKAL